MPRGPDLSLVLPAFNEQPRLPGSLETLRHFAESSDIALEVVVCSDGSTDGTVGIAEQFAAASTPMFRVVSAQIPHRGKGAAVRAGMRHAAAPVTGYTDVDLSAGPDAIKILYDAVLAGTDMAIASRGLEDSILDRRQPWIRERGGRIFNSVLRRVARIPFRDTQCGLKLFRHDVGVELFRHQRLDGFAFDAELVVLGVRLGFDVTELPVRWAHDPNTRVSLVRDSVAMTRDIVRIVRRLGRGEVTEPGVPAGRAIDQMARSEDVHWWYVAKRRLVTSCIEGAAPSGRCLDVGCGGGAMVEAAALHRPAVGIDLSTRALGHAQVRGLRLLVRGEAARLPFAPGSFASALALDVIEHHADPNGLLTEVRRVLAPDGVLIVTVPAFQWMWSYADHVLGHYRRYVRSQLLDELTASGFIVERLTYFHSWLLPVAWGFRKVRAVLRQTEGADDFTVPAALNRLLLGVAAAESRLLARHNLPFGLSLLAVARPQPVQEPAVMARPELERALGIG